MASMPLCPMARGDQLQLRVPSEGHLPTQPGSSVSDGGTYKGISTLFEVLYSTRSRSLAHSLSDRQGDEREKYNSTCL